MNGYIWHSRLKCHVSKINYNCEQRGGMLFVATGECCDMTACIKLFETVDPDVETIRVFAGIIAPVNLYRKERGTWKAYDMGVASASA